MFDRDRHRVYRAAQLTHLEWLEHGFGTKLSQDWPAIERLVQIKQIHSAYIVLAEGHTGVIGEGDAVITNRPGLLLGIRTADCLPILIADPKHRAIAAVHAGWRGTVQEIGPAALGALEQHFESRPEDVIVAIGPGIGVCCYEVGSEVASQFSKYFPERADWDGAANIDLAETNVRQFVKVGVPRAQISQSGICTCCDVEMHSYRREGERAGRMISAIGILAR